MAFDPILPPVRKADAPAVMSICWRGKVQLACNVTLRKSLVDAAGLKSGCKVGVGLGSGDDAGKLAIRPSGDTHFALRAVRAGSLKFDFPAPRAFGGEARGASAAEATWDSQTGSVIVTIPADWLDDEAAAAKPAALLAAAVAPPQPPARGATTVMPTKPAPSSKAKAAAGETFNGVTIDLSPDNESVSFGGSLIEVTTRQARFVSLLARPRPAPVALSFLVSALWDGKPPATAGDAVKQMAADLQVPLSSIGLDLKPVKGVGYQLKDR